MMQVMGPNNLTLYPGVPVSRLTNARGLADEMANHVAFDEQDVMLQRAMKVVDKREEVACGKLCRS